MTLEDLEVLMERTTIRMNCLRKIASTMSDEELQDKLWFWEALTETGEVHMNLLREYAQRKKLRIIIDNT